MKNPTTQLIHPSYQPPAGFAAPQPAIFKASTVIFANTAQMHARNWKDKQSYSYGLQGTPTTFLLEEQLCTLEGGKHCVLLPSGLAAIANVSFALLRAGDEVLIPANAYGPNRTLAEGELAAFGISHALYDPMQPDDLERKISARTRLVWLEVPGSVTMEFADLPALVQICKRKGVISALDNTWGAGLAFQPFNLAAAPKDAADNPAPLGVDISVHALTKYPSGGGDVLMGSIITCDLDLHLKIKQTHMRIGFGVAANDVELVLRSLPSTALRYAAQDQTARTLAHWLQTQPQINQILHPAIEGASGHANWRSLCGENGVAAGLFSLVFDASFGVTEIERFCDSLRLFKLGYSWGGHMSLVMPYQLADMRDVPVSGGPATGCIVRLAIGLEQVQDLQADLAQALAKMQG